MITSDQGTPHLPAVYSLKAFDTVGSTMQEARALAEQGEVACPDGTLIWAREQTEGKGRRGNSWHSPRGNFFASLVTRPEVPARQAAQLGFVAGCAVFDTVGEVCEPGFECRLKWPNDILVNDAKIGGLLLEAKGDPEKPVDYVIIGLGVNLLSHPNDTPYPATSFVAEGQAIPDTVFLESFCRHFLDWATRWVEDGFGPVREQWKWRSRGLGKEIIVRLQGSEIKGIFEDLAEDGSLILNLGEERQIVSAGDVYFPNLGAGSNQ